MKNQWIMITLKRSWYFDFMPYEKLMQYIGIVIIGLSSVFSFNPVHAEECREIIKLYQQSVRQLKEVEKTFLKASCLENSTQKKCQELSSAIREIQGVLQMFMTRFKALQCDPNKKVLSSCEKFTHMYAKKRSEIKEFERQMHAQRCHQRRHSPPCRALKESLKKPRLVLKATREALRKHKCSLSK